MPPKIIALFENIRAVYSKHGFDLFTPWQSWSTLNEFYPSPQKLGDGLFVQTNENNQFERFTSLSGSHPVLGSHVQGNCEAAFQELTDLLGLELVLDVDGESMMTYKGKRTRIYKITKNA